MVESVCFTCNLTLINVWKYFKSIKTIYLDQSGLQCLCVEWSRSINGLYFKLAFISVLLRTQNTIFH